MATGDRRKISLATSLAMRSEDRALRGAGMVAYMAQHGMIEFDLSYPEPLETQFIEAGLDQEKREKFFTDAARIGGNFIGAVNELGRRFPIQVEVDADLMGGKSMVLIGSRSTPGDLRINGDRAEMRFGDFSANNRAHTGCSLQISPTDDSRIAGYLSCGALEYPVSFEIR